MKSYMPKASEDRYCEWIKLCTVRKTEKWESKIWVKSLTWKISEDLLSKVINADTYNSKKIIRVYASWHIFLNENKVYLVTTEKNWKIQHQFTWGSPLEKENKEVIFKENGEYNSAMILHFLENHYKVSIFYTLCIVYFQFRQLILLPF